MKRFLLLPITLISAITIACSSNQAAPSTQPPAPAPQPQPTAPQPQPPAPKPQPPAPQPLTSDEVISLVNQKLNLKPSDKGYFTKLKDPAARAGWFVMRADNTNSPALLAYVWRAWNPAELEKIATEYHMTSRDFLLQMPNLPQAQVSRFAIDVVPSLTEPNLFHDQAGNFYDAAGASGKDLELMQVIDTEARVATTAQTLVAQYSLSEEQGLRVATALQQWKTIGQSRQMTQNDLNALSQDVLGLSVGQIEAATQQALKGDNSAADRLVTEAAKNLDTTPENIRKIIASFMD